MYKFILALCLITTPASSFDNGQWDGIDPATRNWFRGVRSPHGVPCCDIADGHRTKWDMKDNHYWVPINGKWREVPPEAVVKNAGNPFDDAVVWYVQQGADSYHIRCFVPASEV